MRAWNASLSSDSTTLPLRQQVVAVRDRGGELHVLLHEEDGHALGLDLPDDLADALHDHGGEALAGLVEQEQP